MSTMSILPCYLWVDLATMNLNNIEGMKLGTQGQKITWQNVENQIECLPKIRPKFYQSYPSHSTMTIEEGRE